MRNENKGTAAYWDFIDSATGKPLGEGRKIEQNALPTVGGLVIGVAGRPNAIVRKFNFKGIRESLPCYEVYI